MPTDAITKQRNSIAKVRLSQGPTHLKALRIAELIWNQERSKGSLWVSEEPHGAYLARDGKAYSISLKSQPFQLYLAYQYELTKSDPLTASIAETLGARAYNEGDPVKRARFAHWDGTRLLLSTYSVSGNFQLTGQGAPTLIPNGHGGALLLNDDPSTPLQSLNYGNHGLLREAVLKGTEFETRLHGATRSDQELLYYLWFLSTCFPELLKTKPILIVSGEYGAGKTYLLKKAQLILRGKHSIHIRTGKKELPIQLLRSPICCLDNVDKPQDWMIDLLCSYATSGGWTQRQLYTDTDQIDIRPHSFVAITTRNPQIFARQDLADRSLFVTLRRRRSNTAEDLLEKEILAQRPKLYGELLYILNNIVNAYKQLDSDAYAQSKHRMADFARFCYIAALTLNIPQVDVDQALESAHLARGSVGQLSPILLAAERYIRDTGHTLRGTAEDILANHLQRYIEQEGVSNVTPRMVGITFSRLARIPSESPHLQLQVRKAENNRNVYEIKLTSPLH